MVKSLKSVPNDSIISNKTLSKVKLRVISGAYNNGKFISFRIVLSSELFNEMYNEGSPRV